MLTLYNYYRSTASYRVRITLNWKNLSYKEIPVNLLNNGGEQYLPGYFAINPQMLVPALEHDGNVLTQSLAIIEYLEETHPKPALLPQDAYARAQVRSLSLIIACEMHPLNNLRVLQQLRQQFAATDADVNAWYHHWLKLGFTAIEARLSTIKRKNFFCYGDNVTMADICLIPQVYNAHRFKFSIDDYPLINQINQHCLTLEPFRKAAPLEKP